MAEVLRFGGAELRPAERALFVGGQPAALGSRAFDVLMLLVESRERVVSKGELLDRVWPGLVVEENNLQVQVSALRKLLGAQAIATVPGRGYQFTLAPGADAPSPPRAAAAVAAPAVRGGSARVLVADDNKVNRLLLARSLQLLGHQVESVDNGRLALERLRREPFDLLLLDLEMPDLDGFALLARLRDDPVLSELPVVVTSSVEGVAAVARCIELGAEDFLHKPVNPVLLKARVGSLLEKKRLRDEQKALLAKLSAAEGAPDVGATGATIGAIAAGNVMATVLVARLAGDALTDLPADEAIELLGAWATLMVDAVQGQHGLVATLAGDTIVAAFGTLRAAPDAREDMASALRAATDMAELTQLLAHERRAEGRATITTAVGIASGPLLVGVAGAARRAVYACVGAAVERATELVAAASLRPEACVLVDEATAAALEGRVTLRKLARPARCRALPTGLA
jgi:adenylate cyclase